MALPTHKGFSERKGDWLPWLYAVLTLAAFSRCLFHGQAYFDNDLLAQFGPWRAYLRDQILTGHSPLWNPYLLGGCPFLADPQNMVFYPFNWLTLPFSVPTGLSLFFSLHLFLAMAGMDFLLRGFGLSSSSRMVGALVYGFSNFFWLEIIHPPVLAAFALLPWLFGSILIWTQTLSNLRAFLTGLSFALIFLCGSFQLTLGAFYGGSAFLIWGLIKYQTGEPGFPLKKFSSSFCWALFGALPLLAQLIPTREFARLCDRGSGIPWDQLNPSLSLHPLTLYQMFFPRIQLPENMSLAEAIQYRNGPQNLGTNFLGLWAFCGVWTPLLALGAWEKKDRNQSTFWFLFALSALVISLGQFTPIFKWIFLYLPGFSLIRVAYRYLYLFVLAISVLSAWGWENILEGLASGSVLNKYRLVAWLFGLIMLLAGFLRPEFNWREMLALLLGLSAVSLGATQSGFKKILAMGAISIPLFLNAWGTFQPGPSSNFDFEGNSKGLSTWAKSLAPRRILFDNQHMYYPMQVGGKKHILNYPQNAAAPLGIKDLGGYNPLVLKAKTEMGALPFPIVARLSGLGGIVTGMGQESILGFKWSGTLPGFDTHPSPPYLFLTSHQPPNYLFAPQNVISVDDSVSSLALMRDPHFDPDQTAVLLDPPTKRYIIGKNTTNLAYQVLQDDSEAQVFQVKVSDPCLAVICETNYPGWKAWVDGQPVDLLTADNLLRALDLTAGSHRLEFKFQPYWWPGILWGLALWFLLGLRVHGSVCCLLAVDPAQQAHARRRCSRRRLGSH